MSQHIFMHSGMAAGQARLHAMLCQSSRVAQCIEHPSTNRPALMSCSSAAGNVLISAHMRARCQRE